jgi:hypothetical protein
MRDGVGALRLALAKGDVPLACFMLIDLDRSDARTQEPAGETCGYRSNLHSHSTR